MKREEVRCLDMFILFMRFIIKGFFMVNNNTCHFLSLFGAIETIIEID